jgi:hypothetical protein
MANINELDLQPESIPEVAWDAPEPGSFPPPVKPGVHEFSFQLDEQQEGGPYKAVDIQGQRCLEVTYSALTENEQHEEAALNFQRVTTFLNTKMRELHMNHKVGELLRALAIRIDGPLTKERIADALEEATAERRHFRAEVEWRRYCKACETTVTTHPQKKRGDSSWPRNADKQPDDVVACPVCGDKGYGEARITRFKLPEQGAQTVHSGSNGHDPASAGTIPF